MDMTDITEFDCVNVGDFCVAQLALRACRPISTRTAS
jgi:hypothetical protein